MQASSQNELKQLIQTLVDARLDLENILLDMTAEAALQEQPGFLFAQTERGEQGSGEIGNIQNAINSIDSAINDLEGLF